MKTFICWLTAASFLFISEGAVAKEKNCLFVLASTESHPNDVTDQSDVYYYQSDEGDYLLSFDKKRNTLAFDFNQKSHDAHSKGDHWELDLSLPKGINKGLIKDLPLYSRRGTPGLTFSGNRNFCHISTSDINILEVSYDRAGIINSFAANLTENCGNNNPPSFAAIRYNSKAPINVTCSEIFGDNPPESFFYSINTTSNSPDQDSIIRTLINSALHSTKHNTPPQVFSIIPYLLDGVPTLMINVSSQNKSFKMIFSTPDTTGLTVGLHKKNDITSKNIWPNLVKLENGDIYNVNEYFVHEIEIDNNNRVTQLALDFKARKHDKDDKGNHKDVFEAAIRHKSNIPVNLQKPFTK